MYPTIFRDEKVGREGEDYREPEKGIHSSVTAVRRYIIDFQISVTGLVNFVFTH